MILAVFLLALVLDGVAGDPPNRFHPVAWMGAFIRWGAGRAPAHGRMRRFVYGLLLIGLGLALFSLPLAILNDALRPVPWLWVLVNAALLKSAFSLRRLLEAGRGVQRALDADDLPEARRRVSWHLVSRDTRTLGAGHVASAAVESLAENLTDSFIAPLLAFVVGGVPGALAYRFVNTADAMIGYHDERYEHLGKFAARLDDLLNWLPARLAGVLIVLSAGLVGGDWRNAWQVLVRQHGRTLSPNAGWPMSAAAGALGVALEKIGHYRLEGSPELPFPLTIARACRLVQVAAVLWSILCLFLLRGGVP